MAPTWVHTHTSTTPLGVAAIQSWAECIRTFNTHTIHDGKSGKNSHPFATFAIICHMMANNIAKILLLPLLQHDGKSGKNSIIHLLPLLPRDGKSGKNPIIHPFATFAA